MRTSNTRGWSIQRCTSNALLLFMLTDVVLLLRKVALEKAVLALRQITRRLNKKKKEMTSDTED